MHRLNSPKKLTLIDSIICTSLFCIFTGCAPKDEKIADAIGSLVDKNLSDRETIPSSTISIDPVPDVIPTTSVQPSAEDKNRPENWVPVYKTIYHPEYSIRKTTEIVSKAYREKVLDHYLNIVTGEIRPAVKKQTGNSKRCNTRH